MNPVPIVAQYLFSPRHALVAMAIDKCERTHGTTPYLVAKECKIGREMTEFIVSDLIEHKLVVEAGGCIKLQSRKRIDNWVKRFPDASLREYTETVREEPQKRG